MIWHAKLGGRKFLGFWGVLVATVLLAKIQAPGEAYLCIGIAYGALAGADAANTKAAFAAGRDRVAP